MIVNAKTVHIKKGLLLQDLIFLRNRTSSLKKAVKIGDNIYVEELETKISHV